MIITKPILKKILPNGLTVLVRPTYSIPKVSTQLWYNVGSKDEKMGEKGIAHFIEHMIFKGTDKLSESDINLITHKLSGTCNAFTSYDYTGYLFDFPKQHWHEALPIMADCMRNCLFKQEFLKSEMKAVIQELKMYRDNYSTSLVEHLISTIFESHPYHYPIIGFKQDLWSLQREALVAFYKKHYIPNNATLIIVGDVDPEDAFANAEKEFGAIESDFSYQKEEFYSTTDLIAKSVTLYRDVKQPFSMIAFVVPGASQKMSYAIDIISWLLGSGKSSRLQKKLVDELQLVTELETFAYDLFDRGLFFIYFQPKLATDIATITDIIKQEIAHLTMQGPTEQEMSRAMKQAQAEYLNLLENIQKQAYAIGQSYLATGDENYIFSYLEYPIAALQKDVIAILTTYFHASVMHQGYVLPLLEQDQQRWLRIQEQSDREDASILSQITRELEVQDGVQVNNIAIREPMAFSFPKPEKFILDNGMQVLYYHNPNLPKIDCILDFKAKSYYDPDKLLGLNTFIYDMLLEGTKNYSATQLAQEVESLGMNVETIPGCISMSMLSQDFERGLQLLHEIVSQALFDKDCIEKIRAQLHADLQNYWDMPVQFINQLAREQVYGKHPYSKNILGTFETLKHITRKQLVDYYQQWVTPQEAILVIVGDLEQYDAVGMIKKIMGSWQGPLVTHIDFPTLKPIKHSEVQYQINRDQIVLGFAGLSVARTDSDFDKLFIFDQIFTGGVLGSMSSRLFDLRERSGLFYTISGSLVARADEQPGMIYIKTIVSQDRLEEAENVIQQTINTATDTIKDEEFIQAQDAIVSALIDNFESNKQIAASFLFLERFKFPQDYFDKRAQMIRRISIQEVQQAVKKRLHTDNMVTIRVGRL